LEIIIVSIRTLLTSRLPRAIQGALLTGAATSALVLGLSASAHAAPVNERTTTVQTALADSAWGNPNYCTHSVSLGVGWAGTKTVTYLSSYNQYVGSILVHYHRIYVEWYPITGHPYGHTYTQTCPLH
jgi:hypothetical protein